MSWCLRIDLDSETFVLGPDDVKMYMADKTISTKAIKNEYSPLKGRVDNP
jgi:hypothetical protein